MTGAIGPAGLGKARHPRLGVPFDKGLDINFCGIRVCFAMEKAMSLRQVVGRLLSVAVFSWAAVASADDLRVLSIAITPPEMSDAGQAYDHAFRLG